MCAFLCLKLVPGLPLTTTSFLCLFWGDTRGFVLSPLSCLLLFPCFLGSDCSFYIILLESNRYSQSNELVESLKIPSNLIFCFAQVIPKFQRCLDSSFFQATLWRNMWALLSFRHLDCDYSCLQHTIFSSLFWQHSWLVPWLPSSSHSLQYLKRTKYPPSTRVGSYCSSVYSPTRTSTLVSQSQSTSILSEALLLPHFPGLISLVL